MEIRTCEEYVLAELEELKRDNAYFVESIGRLRDERDGLLKEKARLEIQCERMARRLNELNAGEGFEPAREVPDGD